MPENTHDPILSILKAYERDPGLNDKKAVLLSSQGGYFLYGNRFCSTGLRIGASKQFLPDTR